MLVLEHVHGISDCGDAVAFAEYVTVGDAVGFPEVGIVAGVEDGNPYCRIGGPDIAEDYAKFQVRQRISADYIRVESIDHPCGIYLRIFFEHVRLRLLLALSVSDMVPCDCPDRQSCGIIGLFIVIGYRGALNPLTVRSPMVVEQEQVQ